MRGGLGFGGLLGLVALLFTSGRAPLANAAGFTPTAVVVCYPGGPVQAREANGAMESMLRVVERVGQFPPGAYTSHFTAKVAECKKLLSEKKPAFAIASLGLYLELREQYHWMPLVQPKIQGRTSEIYRILIAKGKYKSLDELKGKTLGGTPLEEPLFLERIVFRGRVAPATFFEIKAARQALRALRQLAKGELDAVIVNEQQYHALGSLPFANQLEVLFSSDSIPLMGVVADERSTTAEERARFLKAISSMCSDAAGKKLCDLFGVEGFVGVDPADYQQVISLWNDRGSASGKNP